MYTLSGVKQTAGEEVLRGAGSPIWRSGMTYRGGKGEGRGLGREGCMYKGG